LRAVCGKRVARPRGVDTVLDEGGVEEGEGAEEEAELFFP
jgi:hypothetical protein